MQQDIGIADLRWNTFEKAMAMRRFRELYLESVSTGFCDERRKIVDIARSERDPHAFVCEEAGGRAMHSARRRR